MKETNGEVQKLEKEIAEIENEIAACNEKHEDYELQESEELAQLRNKFSVKKAYLGELLLQKNDFGIGGIGFRIG